MKLWVGWLESARHANIPNYEKEPLIAVKRDNLQHEQSYIIEGYMKKLAWIIETIGGHTSIERRGVWRR